jgi:CelD/BcsL family acetyltransferase involved in cellulose biosynthesis
MNYEVINARGLTSRMLGRWAQIQNADPTLASPYFTPEFVQAVAIVRDDVQVGLIIHNRSIEGFFPFHRKRGRVARPIGLGLSDYHGVVAIPDAQWTVAELMRGFHLVRWAFDHLPASQSQFAEYAAGTSQSPVIDLSQGYDHYKTNVDKAARKQIREVKRKREKLDSTVGPVRFIRHSADKSILRQMMAWKSQQCRQTGTVDYFSLKWCADLIERIHQTQKENFGGVLSCLYAGEKLAAVHFAMYARTFWHSWFPAYNDDFKAYSPGLILLYEMIQSAASEGIHWIDLGKGMSLYKKRVMTGSMPIAEGCVEIPSIENRLYHFRRNIELWSRQSSLNAMLRIPGRLIKNFERKRRFE